MHSICRTILTFCLCLAFTPLLGAPNTAKRTARLHLQLADAPSPSQFLSAAIKRDEQHLRNLQHRQATRSSTPTAKTLVETGTGNYIVKVGFGSPNPATQRLLLDTGSDITWTKCSSSSSTSLAYDPSKSETCVPLPCASHECAMAGTCDGSNCTFTMFYNDGSVVRGEFVHDTVMLGNERVASLAFGCGRESAGRLVAGADGVFALGKGPLSVPSQTADSFGGVFSHCLPSFGDVGSLFLGEVKAPEVKYVPLVRRAECSDKYFVRLLGVAVGGEFLKAGPLDVMVDSGTFVSRFDEGIFAQLRDAFRRKCRHLAGAPAESIFQTCFEWPSESAERGNVPSVVFVFENGVELALDWKHVLVRMPGNGHGSAKMCMAFASTADVMSKGLNIIGGFQLQDFRIVYDLPNSRLGFLPEQCSLL